MGCGSAAQTGTKVEVEVFFISAGESYYVIRSTPNRQPFTSLRWHEGGHSRCARAAGGASFPDGASPAMRRKSSVGSDGATPNLDPLVEGHATAGRRLTLDRLSHAPIGVPLAQQRRRSSVSSFLPAMLGGARKRATCL